MVDLTWPDKHDAICGLFRGPSHEIDVKSFISLYELRDDGGDGGIRTLDRALQPYNGLANRRLQPLGHISGRSARRDICPTRSPIASVWRRSLAGLQRQIRGQGRRRKSERHAQGVGQDRGGFEAAAAALCKRLLCAIMKQPVHRGTQPSPPISNAKHEQADQARPNRRQPRLISRYVGTRKPIRRRATCLTILRSALASLSCA